MKGEYVVKLQVRILRSLIAFEEASGHTAYLQFCLE